MLLSPQVSEAQEALLAAQNAARGHHHAAEAAGGELAGLQAALAAAKAELAAAQQQAKQVGGQRDCSREDFGPMFRFVEIYVYLLCVWCKW